MNIEQNLKRHYEHMQAYIRDGLTVEQASAAAYEDVTKGNSMRNNKTVRWLPMKHTAANPVGQQAIDEHRASAKSPTFQHRHYEAIAECLRAQHPVIGNDAHESIVSHMIGVLKSDNPKFDPERFRKAATHADYSANWT